VKQDRIIKQLDRMVDKGELTAEEAADLRAAEGTPDFERVMGGIRARHAQERMEPAVVAGEMTQREADDYLDRIRAGEHPKGLRARLGSHRARQH
jgi:polyhydroxyalkanoate synthesis regulator phasin